MRYIDLFAGIGGFHVALHNLGHECVFASELSEELQDLYERNHGLECHGDITKIAVENIPEHDILCAGFPCQTFSKAGNQKGMKEARGKLFDEIIKILTFHRPRYFLLENVRNLITHDKGKTWEYISTSLSELGYAIDKRILSPHFINIPQHRERIFIVGSLNNSDIDNIKWPEQEEYHTSIRSIINDDEVESNLETDKIEVLKVWQEFLDCFPENSDPYTPLWSMEFGATYPLKQNWGALSLSEWQKYKGSYGYPLSLCSSIKEVWEHLPNYVKTQDGIPPRWKQIFLRNNRRFFHKSKAFIKPEIIDKIKDFKQESWKKFEWHCQGLNKDFKDKLIQFRGSGIRVKKEDYLPSLVTIRTQIPIIGEYMRYLRSEEGARVQSLPEEILLPTSKAGQFRVLGNMVNIELVYRVAAALLEHTSCVEEVRECAHVDNHRVAI